MRGRLLVAAPPLVDPNFDRTVVLVLEHSDDGALGIVLNRPSATELDDVLPEWRPLASSPTVVFAGGPVSTDAVIALAQADTSRIDGGVQVLADLGTIDLASDPLDSGVPLDELRVFVGYAGWSPGQLEAEIAASAWFVVDLARGDPFVAAPERLWRDVLRRQRGRVAVFANYPDDVTAN